MQRENTMTQDIQNIVVWVFRAILSFAALDYIRFRLKMSEKYILKEDCRRESDRLESICKEIFAKLDENTKMVFSILEKLGEKQDRK